MCRLPPACLQYRARQKRLVANSSRMSANRSRLLRDVEDALRRWGLSTGTSATQHVTCSTLHVLLRAAASVMPSCPHAG